MAESTVDVAFTNQYSANVYQLCQQRGSKMRNRVRNETVTSAQYRYFDRLGEAEAQDITSRHGNTPLNEIAHTRRRLLPVDTNTATLMDKQDELKTLISPTSSYAQSQAMALGRKIDDRIITDVQGTVYSGVAGATSITFASDSYSINGDATATVLGTAATAAGAGTVADISMNKMLLMMQIFNEADCDPDIPKHWMVAPKTMMDMLALTEPKSVDYNTVKVLMQGKIDTWMGFSWFWSNRVTKDSGETAYDSLAWAQDGIILGVSENITSRITERDDKNYTTQIYAEMSMGALRLDGDKVHECLNKVA